MYEIAGKVALITGGASGIGLEIARALLENGLRAVTIVGRNETKGKLAQNTLTKQYGENRAVFIQADVCDKNQLDDAFKSTIELFKNLDVVVNNAASLSGQNWELEIQTNLVGICTGTILAAEKYLPKYKTGEESVVLNMSSILGLDNSNLVPVYSATKSAIIGLSRSFGSKLFYEKSKVRVMVICPGFTATDILKPRRSWFLNQFSMDAMIAQIQNVNIQDVNVVSELAIQMIKSGETGSVWVVENSEPSYEIDALFGRRLKKQENFM